MSGSSPFDPRSKPHSKDQRRNAWRPQFTLRFMFRAMLLVSILAAALSGLLREGVNPGSGTFLLILAITVAAPLGVMIVLSVIRTAGAWWQRRAK